MDNNLKLQLMEILKSASGQKAKAELKSMNVQEIEKKLMSVDKNEVIRKLESMNLSPVAQKLKTMSDEELVNMIRKNPSFLNFLDRL